MGWLWGRVGISLCPLAFYDSLYTVSLLTHYRILSLAGACVKCSKGVFGAGQACQAMGNLYHDACFTCAACSKCLCLCVSLSLCLCLSLSVLAGRVRNTGTREARREMSILPGDTCPSSLHGLTGRLDIVL